MRYDATLEKIRPILKSEDAVASTKMQRELGEFFRGNYKEALREVQ